MSDPWDIRKSEGRNSDSITNFIIFCEDGVCEPEYFRSFQSDRVKINTIIDQKSGYKHVTKAIRFSKTESFASGTQIWCVFDLDRSPHSENIDEYIEFDEAIDMAQRKGFKVAWSNDAFELWVLLHFLDIDINDHSYKDRSTYYDRLTHYFQNETKDDNQLTKLIDGGNFGYKKNLKSKKYFIPIVLRRMKLNTAVAIARAEKIYERFEKKGIQNSEKCPCTLVFKLIKEIQNAKGENVET